MHFRKQTSSRLILAPDSRIQLKHKANKAVERFGGARTILHIVLAFTDRRLQPMISKTRLDV